MRIFHPLENTNVPPAKAGTPHGQREFARRVSAVEALKASQRASLAELDALFASLPHRAFRGELGVPPSGGGVRERKSA